jgi:hypothetical protein
VKGKRGTGPNGDLTKEEIALRDLRWLVEEAGEALSAVLGRNEKDVPAFLRGIAKTASKTALHYEKRMGIPSNGQGRPRLHV